MKAPTYPTVTTAAEAQCLNRRGGINDVSISMLHELFAYCPISGTLTWKIRPLHHFIGLSNWKAANARCAGKAAGSLNGQGYLTVHIGGKNILAHRVIFAMNHGYWPSLIIDHVDGDRTNNRITNLREITNRQNVENQRAPSKNNTSGYLGVHFDKRRRKFVASIKIDRKAKFLGHFLDPQKAYEAYLAAKRELHSGCTI